MTTVVHAVDAAVFALCYLQQMFSKSYTVCLGMFIFVLQSMALPIIEKNQVTLKRELSSATVLNNASAEFEGTELAATGTPAPGW
eukprot:CAMPEP_0119307756 /NCGR_PEP_ID=MMETSP1333-20130426/8156_1 /TAXON_ID=418940 /ORGANISM="Scyphosphaera apsteinii, Strain RCC1455" /LENGTH=84 /DNA_ID=CAMNT_0007311359 /DNA_START=72 /DNA_END=323 /DNA_ORIENTATION=+